MEENKNDWPELAIGLYDKLTGRDAVITYEFENMTVGVPGGTESKEHAKWNLNGKLTISTANKKDHKSN